MNIKELVSLKVTSSLDPGQYPVKSRGTERATRVLRVKKTEEVIL